MATLNIRKLTVNVKVDKKAAESPLGREPKAARPGLLYAAPKPALAGQATALGEPEATQAAGRGDAPVASAAPGSADPVKVADRVYNLMMEELRMSRSRGR
ncbi:hypothetical protein EON81_12920 [bacterium]|nr:MAG: hypothetical protein EON81_12920 [bacterium]